MNAAETGITSATLRFVETTTYDDLPAEALDIGRRCIVDALGLYLAGSREPSVRILIEDALDQGGRADAPLPVAGKRRVPAPRRPRLGHGRSRA